MKQFKTNAVKWTPDVNRRDFLRGTSMATIATMMGGVPLIAADEAPKPAGETAKPKKPDVKCGVIGLGAQGREVLTALAALPNAPVVAICDSFEGMLGRAKKLAPNAETYTDYKQLLANKDVKAVIIATPTHKHREIVEAAFAAGKHVYCESPMANTMEDSRAIALAARKNLRLNFQVGLQKRADPQHPFALKYIRAGATGNFVKARSQWAKKTSWRRTSATAEREKELNWRLYNETSLGLVGELGIHQVDVISWYLKALPRAVTGFGSLQYWSKDNDDRDVFDTVQAVFEFPGKVNYFYDASLANTYEAEYEILYGSDAAMVMRGANAWMFRESDAPLLGWEVYCRKEEGVAYKEAGLSMRADSTKVGAKALEEVAYSTTSLKSSMEAFVANVNTRVAAMEDYDLMGADPKDEKALLDYLNGDSLKKAQIPCASWEEGYQADVMVIKANESIVKGQKIVFSKEWFQL